MQAELNVLLYGPPGTGKTYHTIFKAVEICDGPRPASYKEAKDRFDALKKEGRVEFVTFHQSYGYEEFIEGIRAKSKRGKISYEVRPGLLKKMVEKATEPPPFDAVYDRLKEQKLRSKEPIRVKLTTQERFCSIVGVNSEGSFHVEPAKDVSGRRNKYTVTRATLKRMWPQRSNLQKPTDLGKYDLETTDASYYLAVLKHLEKIEIPYVLIIDEINRGNISKIFGELITLIEEDKRIGADHEMLVRLPLSGDAFGVPKNLYIIGTMNTADRSIAMMDTALRRRFVFEEMMPNPWLLNALKGEDATEWVQAEGGRKWQQDYKKDLFIEQQKGKRINVRRMLYAMNQRIEALYDREHTIGHAYFMPLKDNPSLELLASIFEHKIIPLLAEYFFEDWGRIRLVLGDNQKEDNEYQFITEISVDKKSLFGGKDLPADFDWEESKTYTRKPEALKHPESYIGIYDPDACKAARGGAQSSERTGSADE